MMLRTGGEADCETDCVRDEDGKETVPHVGSPVEGQVAGTVKQSNKHVAVAFGSCVIAIFS